MCMQFELKPMSTFCNLIFTTNIKEHYKYRVQLHATPRLCHTDFKPENIILNTSFFNHKNYYIYYM